MLFFLALSLVFFSFSFSLAFSSQLLRAMSLYFTVTACRRCVRYFNKLLALGPVFTSMCRIRWFRHLLPPTSLYSFRSPPSSAPTPHYRHHSLSVVIFLFQPLLFGSRFPLPFVSLTVCLRVCLSLYACAPSFRGYPAHSENIYGSWLRFSVPSFHCVARCALWWFSTVSVFVRSSE